MSFVPVFVLVGDAYFLGKGLYAGVATGQWDWLNIGLSAVDVAGMAMGPVRMLEHADDLGRIANRGVGIIRNPFGRLGRPEHRVAISHLQELIEVRDLRWVTEFWFRGAGGRFFGRFADVVALDRESGRVVEIY